MKPLKSLSILLIIISALFTGCNKDDNGGINNSEAFKILTNHLDIIEMDIAQVMGNPGDQYYLMEAPDNGDLSDKWIMDIRNLSDFVTGHIENANQAGYKDILVAATAADKPILVVDYTGEVSSYVVALLRLYGYNDAQALKWGMSGWNESLDGWTENCDDLTSEENWTKEIYESGSYESPQLIVNASNGDAILKERIEKVFAGGYKGILPAKVLENHSDYFIHCYTTLEDYLGFGHIEGSVQLYPVGLETLNRIDSRSRVVVYSHSGHNSAVITAYLNVLGFDTYNLKYGLNGMTKSNSYWSEDNSGNHWGFTDEPKNLPIVTGNE